MVDLGSLFGGADGNDRIIEPRKIFTTLTRSSRFKRPSDEQGESLDKWFPRRNEGDLTLKMNTGSGKTLVGLLALQSSLNEDVGPAVYATPDKYLSQQALKEARELGIRATDNLDDRDFLQGKSILITNIRKIINGRSRFGVGRMEIEIGSIVIDDAHACITSVGDQFSLTASNLDPLYRKI